MTGRITGAPCFVGLDIGTSGVRALAIDADGQIQGRVAVDLPAPLREGQRVEQAPALWWDKVLEVLHGIRARITGELAAIAVAGTSGSVLLADASGQPLSPGLLYNDARATLEAAQIADIAPPASGAHGATSSLSKALWLLTHQALARPTYILHQADWIMGRLCGRFGLSDENNALKLGYDPITRGWPGWLTRLGLDMKLMPQILPPGSAIGSLELKLAVELKLEPAPRVVTGTTDSVASLLATGVTQPGDAVTALGSTLALKVISLSPVFAPSYGIYSHRLGNLWLAGGASNTGGAVLRAFFSQAELDALTPGLRADAPTGLDYYPLITPGERFPVNDSHLAPRLTPQPDDPVCFLQGLLEGMAAIERRGYERLHELGAPYPKRVFSTGGGARNSAWTMIRQRALGVAVHGATHHEAAYGAACLARQGALRGPDPRVTPDGGS